jgi:DNA-binding NarL/FixJ family response regulator
MAGMTIRLGVVDDHPLVVQGFDSALGAIPGFEVAAHGTTLADARALLARDDLDVLLLDVRLEDGNGLQALAERGERQRPAVLVLSSFMAAQYVAAASRFGASGFLLKVAPLPALIEAIRAVAAGDQVFTSAQLGARFINLTPREREVLELAMDGRSNKEIGAAIGTSRKTVEAHLSGIYRKYDVLGGRIELSIRAAAEGWLEIELPTPTPRQRPLRSGSEPSDPS